MRFSPECVPCLLNRVIYEVELVAPDKVQEAVEESLHILSSEFPKGMNSAALATKVHARVYEISGSKDPYADLKMRSDLAAEQVFPRAKDFVDRSDDRLRAAVQCAIAGNVLDFGIDVGLERPEELGRKFERLLAEGLAIDDLEEARRLMRKARSVVYLLDNCGESVFDLLLVQEIKSLGPKVIGVVKGAPILTDVTMEDAQRVHIDRCFDQVLSTGVFAVGLDLSRAPMELSHALEEADLIVSKGMANFESLSDECFGPVLYLLRAKCGPVAESIGAERNQNVARLAARPDYQI
jgi:uncharacterized protein with ATP-grasp and redox domains